ncbi:MAG: hypothetical protein K2N56_02395 [Oscillospiraceae bacterium]|nr:hypothetical protein [Oscillospiraceae bacterium]
MNWSRPGVGNDPIEIDTRHCTVTSGGVLCNQYLSADSVFFKLLPEENQLAVINVGAESNDSVMTWHDHYLGVCYDQEDKSQIDGLSTRTRTDMAIMFCETIRAANYTPGIYANPSWFENYYKKSELLGKYDIWLACRTENPDMPTKYNYGQRIWQWGLDNIAGYNVDGDLSYYDYSLAGKQDPTLDSENLADIRIGDTVMFKGGSHYVSSTAENATGGTRSAGLAEVMNIAPDAPYKYALRGVDGGSNAFTAGSIAISSKRSRKCLRLVIKLGSRRRSGQRI